MQEALSILSTVSAIWDANEVDLEGGGKVDDYPLDDEYA